jgi:hypothetical protein
VTVTATPLAKCTATQATETHQAQETSQANPFLWNASRIDVVFSDTGATNCKWKLNMAAKPRIASGSFYCVKCLCDENQKRLLGVERKTDLGNGRALIASTIDCGKYICFGATETLGSQLPLGLVAPVNGKYVPGEDLEVYDH